jgi:hypothetical protein
MQTPEKTPAEHLEELFRFCAGCTKDLNEDKDMFVTCTGCDRHFCGACRPICACPED